MTTFRENTTFPFLKIARERGLPYGDVIRTAEAIDGKGPFNPERVLSPEHSSAIYFALEAEQERRENVAAMARLEQGE